MAKESRDGATNEEPPRPPIQASDALSVHSTKASSQQITGTSTLASASVLTFKVSTNNSCSYQSLDDETAATIFSAVLANEEQYQQQTIQQMEQSLPSSLGSAASVTYVDNSSGRSGAQAMTHSGAPRTPDREIDGKFEVWMYKLSGKIINK